VCSNKNSLAVSHDYRDRQTGHVDFRIIGSSSFVTYKFSSYCELWQITYKFTLVVHFTSGTKTYFTFIMACCEWVFCGTHDRKNIVYISCVKMFLCIQRLILYCKRPFHAQNSSLFDVFVCKLGLFWHMWAILKREWNVLTSCDIYQNPFT
jgi:hypothetical protein